MPDKQKHEVIYYGSRKGDKFVRCYSKDGLGVFRVEVELHGGLLRRNDILTLDHFVCLPDIVYPKHLQFVDFDWGRLRRYLVGTLGDEGNRIYEEAKNHATSQRRLRRYLRRKRIANIHRFLVPLGLNDSVISALKRWARHFKKGSQWVSTK